MSEMKSEAESEKTETGQKAAHNPWDDVIHDFQALGESITRAIQGAVQDERSKKPLNEVKQGLENVADQVTKSVNEAAQSARSQARSQNIKTEVRKAVDEVKDMGDKVYSESKPILVNALATLGEGIQMLIERLEDMPDKAPETSATGEPTVTKSGQPTRSEAETKPPSPEV